MAGAALGTVIARGVGVGIVFYLFYAGKHEVKILPGSYRPVWQMFKDIFAIGVPSGVQALFRNGSRLLLLGLVTSTDV